MTDTDDIVERAVRAVCKSTLSSISTYGDEICCQFAPASRRQEGCSNDNVEVDGPLRCCREDFIDDTRAAINAACPGLLDGTTVMVPRIEIAGGEAWPEAISTGLILPCALCHTVPFFDYVVDDEFWHLMVSEEDRLGVVCLPCLSRITSAAGVNIADKLINVQFTGRGETIVLEPVKIVLYDLFDVI